MIHALLSHWHAGLKVAATIAVLLIAWSAWRDYTGPSQHRRPLVAHLDLLPMACLCAVVGLVLSAVWL